MHTVYTVRRDLPSPSNKTVLSKPKATRPSDALSPIDERTCSASVAHRCEGL